MAAADFWAVPANVEMAFEKSSPDELGYADANLVLRKMKILSPMTEEDEETVMEYVSGKASTDGRIQLPEMLACVVAAASSSSPRTAASSGSSAPKLKGSIGEGSNHSNF